MICQGCRRLLGYGSVIPPPAPACPLCKQPVSWPLNTEELHAAIKAADAEQWLGLEQGIFLQQCAHCHVWLGLKIKPCCEFCQHQLDWPPPQDITLALLSVSQAQAQAARKNRRLEIGFVVFLLIAVSPLIWGLGLDGMYEELSTHAELDWPIIRSRHPKVRRKRAQTLAGL